MPKAVPVTRRNDRRSNLVSIYNHLALMSAFSEQDFAGERKFPRLRKKGSRE